MMNHVVLMNTTGGEAMAFMLLCLYFLPSIMAHKKRSSKAIFALNLFLGWTLIGWVVAICWAASPEPSQGCGKHCNCH